MDPKTQWDGVLCRLDLLVVVLLFLLSPVLVELVDFHSGVALLKQVKSLQTATRIQLGIQEEKLWAET